MKKNYERYLPSYIIQGYVIAKYPTADTSTAVIRVLTHQSGKLSLLFKQNISTSYTHLPLYMFDLLDISVIAASSAASLGIDTHAISPVQQQTLGQYNGYTTPYSSSLLKVREVATLSSFSEQSIDIDSPHEHTLSSIVQQKYFMLAANILNQHLLDREPHPQAWQLVETLVATLSLAKDIKVFPLLIASLFFSQEGISQNTFDIFKKRLNPILFQNLEKDIDIIFNGKGADLFDYTFSDITVTIVADLLGIDGKK